MVNKTEKDENVSTEIREIKEILVDISEQKKEKERNNRHEIIVTILLSLATLVSAWCSYQANIWDDEDKKLKLLSVSLEEEANKKVLESNQLKSVHSNFVMTYMEHFQKGDSEYCNFMLARADSILKPAMEEWIKKNPLKNPDVPSPLLLDSYKDYPMKQAIDFKTMSSQKKSESERANNFSDKYMHLTVLFALVLFFSGISGTLKNNAAQILSLIISVIVLVASVIILMQLPVGYS
jgi:hypothetical protein